MTKRPWFAPAREEILGCLRAAGVPMTPSELAERLAVQPADVDSLNKRLAAMERDGQLLPNRKGVLLLASKLDLIAGRVQGHRDGFGFLLPDAGGPDVFLSPREMQKVMHRDRALVKQTGYDSRGRPEGRIVEVTERANRQLVGRFLNERGVHIVVPEDQRIKHDIVIAPGDTHGAQPGQVVTAEIVNPPLNGSPPIGRVVEVLGEIDDPGMEIEIAVRKFDVPHVFSAAALAQSAALPGEVRPAELKGRVDLRDLPLVTIDGEDARDFDDAVYCEQIELPPGLASEAVGDPQAVGDGHGGEDGGSGHGGGPGFRLLVAIADVSHYVKPGEPIDVDATERSTSVYFPRRVIPMLPEKLSNGLCSLNPQVDRLVLVCDAVIDARGRVRAYQFYEAVMHSAARLTYDEVWAMLSGSPAAARLSARHQALVPNLRELHELFRVLQGARERRGAMEIETVETQIVCDPAGRIERIIPRTRNDAHRLIEECMLAANVCAADFMHRSRHPGLYRIHEGPTVEKLLRLRVFLRTVGLSLGGGERPGPRDYAALSVQMLARPDHLLLQTMLLRSMQQAVYSPDNVGHFGLAYDAYAHFTSPIRRYPDLLTHRVIKALIRGSRFRLTGPVLPGLHEDADNGHDHAGHDPVGAGKAAGARSKASQGAGHEAPEAWHQWGALCSANERRADEASRDVEAWLKCMYMRERVGEQFAGQITGVAQFGVFVTLNDLYVEGMVHVSELGGEYFQYNEAGHELRGERTGRRFRLTDPIDVQVSRVDLEARRMEFRLVERTDFRGLNRDRPPAAREQPGAERERPKAERSDKGAEPAKSGPGKSGPAKPEPVEPKPTKAEPAKAEPTKAEPAKAQPQAAPSRLEPPRAGPLRRGPAPAAAALLRGAGVPALPLPPELPARKAIPVASVALASRAKGAKDAKATKDAKSGARPDKPAAKAAVRPASAKPAAGAAKGAAAAGKSAGSQAGKSGAKDDGKDAGRNAGRHKR